MLSFTFPSIEMHHSKEPIAFVFYPSKQIKAYKLRVLSGKYFYVMDGKKYQGIFELDPRKAYHYGKGVPIYFYDSRNILPIDPIVVNEISHYAKKQHLVQLSQTDSNHSGMLNDIMKTVSDKTMAIQELVSKVNNRKTQITAALAQFQDNVAKTPGDQMPPEDKLGSILTNHLVEKGLISNEEKGMIDSSVARGSMSVNSLIAKLRDKEILRITEPMSQDMHTFLNDFGSSNPEQLASFVAGLRRLDKGVKTMTSIPIKTWMPASIIMALLIGGSIAGMILLQNMGDLGSIIPLPQSPSDLNVPVEPEVIEPEVIEPEPIPKPNMVWDAVNQRWTPDMVFDEPSQSWIPSMPEIEPEVEP